MVQIVLIGIGAGIAAGVLFASIVSGAMISLVLFYLAPLPILIAALGWSHWAGLIAALVAASGLAVTFSGYLFLAFLLGVGLPAWWLCYLALLARPVATPAGNMFEWYPIGGLVVWTAILSSLVVIAVLLTLGTSEDDIRSELRRGFERMLRQQDTPLAIPASPDYNRRIDMFVAVAPPAAAVSVTLINLISLWLAGRIVKVSNRLRRPWPNISEMAFPPISPALLGAAAAGVLLPGLLGMVSSIFAASFATAYVVLGCAVLHAITRGLNIRGLLLSAVYVAIVLVWPVIVLIALLGLTDSIVDIRGWIARKRGPPTIQT